MHQLVEESNKTRKEKNDIIKILSSNKKLWEKETAKKLIMLDIHESFFRYSEANYEFNCLIYCIELFS
jgi:hypothetical protein